MNITKRMDGLVKIIEFDGSLDYESSQTVHDTVVPEIQDSGKVVLDMSHCVYVASSGMRALVVFAKQSALVGCRTVLAGVQPQVWDVISLTGFEDVLESYPDTAAAVLAMK